MPNASRLIAVATLAAAVGLFVGTGVSAQEETPEPISEEPAPEVPDPAVSIVPEPPVEERAPWTTIYLVPAALLIGAGTVLITIVMYFFRVTRARYRPQE
ncbi:MAG: hypothetical protein ACE5MI_06150 [Acidimicrobiia bacterium]